MTHCRQPCTGDYTCSAGWTDENGVQRDGTCDDYYQAIECRGFEYEEEDCHWTACRETDDLCWLEICDNPSHCLPATCVKHEFNLVTDLW